MALFELGSVVFTIGVCKHIKKSNKFSEFVFSSFNRYRNGDWGDTCDADKKTNDEALKNGELILAVYKDSKSKKTIWIITERDRRATTILFPEEY